MPYTLSYLAIPYIHSCDSTPFLYTISYHMRIPSIHSPKYTNALHTLSHIPMPYTNSHNIQLLHTLSYHWNLYIHSPIYQYLTYTLIPVNIQVNTFSILYYSIPSHTPVKCLTRTHAFQYLTHSHDIKCLSIISHLNFHIINWINWNELVQYTYCLITAVKF